MTSDIEPTKWCIYLLSNGRRTYIGATTNVPRRLRQHNGELVGGARATSRTPGKWKLVCWISGFETQSSAYRWEKLMKLRAKGVYPRAEAMEMLSQGRCIVHKPNAKVYEVPAGLGFHIS